MYSVSQVHHDYRVRVVAELVARFLREEPRVAEERMFAVLQHRADALTRDEVAAGLAMLERSRLAWRDTAGLWDAASLRILFVDDEETRQRRYAQEASGHRIRPARDAAEAIRILEEVGPDFDLIMLDHDLGGAEGAPTGRAVAEWLASRFATYGRIPVICHSLNHSGREAICATLQAAGYLAAPLAFAWQWPPITSLIWLVEGEPKECAVSEDEPVKHDSTGSRNPDE